MDGKRQHQISTSNEAIESSPLTGVLINTVDEIIKLTESCDKYTCILQTYHCLHKPPLVASGYTSSKSDSLKSNSENDDEERSNFSKLARDQITLGNLNDLLGILPILNELADYLKSVPISLVPQLIRCIHCLNGNYNEEIQEECLLLGRCWYYIVFIPLMDLLFCLVRLERLTSSMLKVNESLRVFKEVCSIVVDLPIGKKNEQNHRLNLLSREKLSNLFDTVDNIQSEIFNSESILERFFTNFRLLIQEQASNLFLSNTSLTLSGSLERFLSFYLPEMIDITLPLSSSKQSNHVISNLIPTRYMTTPSRRLLGSILVFLLYCRTFEKIQNSVIKNMMNILLKFKSMNLVFLGKSNLTISLNELLTRHLPNPILKSNSKTIRMVSSVGANGNTLDGCESFICQTLSWHMQFKALFFDQKNNSHVDTRSLIKRQLINLRSGIKLASSINETIGRYVALNSQYTICSMHVFQQVALIKSIEASIEECRASVEKVLVHRNNLIREELEKLKGSLKDRLISLGSKILSSSNKDYSSNTLFTATILASRLASEGTTLTYEQLSISLLELAQILCPEDLRRLNDTIELMTRDLGDELKRATSFSSMFWCLPSLGSFYKWALEEDPCAIKELHYIHLALDDMKELFTWTEECEIENLAELSSEREEFFAGLEEELLAQFKSNFFDRISQELETELRLQVHRKLQLADSHNSFKRHVYNLKHIFHLADEYCSEFRLLGKQVSLRTHVEDYLNRVFVKLTSITPSDWYTYDSMIHLAKRKYGLQLAPLQLYSEYLEEAPLDLLNVARNLSSFVARYAYDHTLRRFIEKNPTTSHRWSTGCSSVSSSHLLDSDSSSVNLLQVEHVQRSIETHGFSVINGPVNRCYQLMKKLLGLFSRQMSDERLKAALGKEEAAFQADNLIGYERAEALTSLYTSSSSGPINNHLEALRLSVTQFGNVLAFLGLLKTGSLRCASANLSQLPEPMNPIFSGLIGGHLEFSRVCNSEVGTAVANLNEYLSSAEHQFSPTADYLRSMVDLFAVSLQQQQPQHTHLASFFLLIPSLCIQYVNHLTGCKERLEARGGSVARAHVQLSDDGFPLGVAFLLVALNQRREFARLQWFERVAQKMQRDRLQFEMRANNKTSCDESLKQTALMSLRRINKLAQEYEALSYALCAALFSLCPASASAAASAAASASQCPPPARR